MKSYEALILLLINCISITESSRPSVICRVTETATNTDVPCQFPFILNGKTYNECTSAQDPEGRKWCSTRVTDREIHIGSMSYWGHCSRECIDNREAETNIFEGHNYQFLNENVVCRSCSNWKNCPWANKLLAHLRTIKKSDPARGKFIQFLRTQRCGNEAHNVCCETAKKSLHVTPPPVIARNKSDKSLGTWKPETVNSECGVSAGADFIFGGENAKIGEFPFMALLGFDSPFLKCTKTVYLCAGSLINKHYILTAAHCLNDKALPLREIALGDHDVLTDPDCSKFSCIPKIQRRVPKEIILHEKWNKRKFTEGYDIALIRMDEPVILAAENPTLSILTPICLPWNTLDQGRDISAGDETIIAGWGKITNDKNITHHNYCNFGSAERVLQKLKVDVSSDEDCNLAFPLFDVDKEQQLCSGGIPGEDSCGGDSGGPLIYKKNDLTDTPMFQVGIVSFGTSNCGIGKPGIYTRVVNFLDWIENNLKP